MYREYPHISFNHDWKLSSGAWRMIGECEAYANAIANTPILPHYYDELMKVSLLKGAQSTTAIEGNTLTDSEIEQLISGKNLPPSQKYQQKEVKNVVDALNELLIEMVEGGVNKLISEELLLRFHRLIGHDLGESFAATPGKFRNTDVIVGTYRCPDYRDVPELVNKLCAWMKNEFSFGNKQQEFHNVLIQAIVCHVYIEWIHPFNDGNGRTGRLVEYYILLRGGNPDIASHILSNYYNQTRPQYYYHLDKAAKERDIKGFIEYAIVGFRDGLVAKLNEIQKSQFENTWHAHIYNTFDELKNVTRNEVFRRRRKLALSLPINIIFRAEELPGLSIPLAQMYSGKSLKTIQRELEKLYELGLIKKEAQSYKTNTEIILKMMAKRNHIGQTDNLF